MCFQFKKDKLMYNTTKASNNGDETKELKSETNYHEINKKYTYIFIHNKQWDTTAGSFKVYRKAEGDEGYTFVGEVTEAYSQGKIARIKNTVKGTVSTEEGETWGTTPSYGYTVHTLETYLPKEQMTETADIVADGSTLYFEEDFSGTLDTTNVWNTTNKNYSKIENGALCGTSTKQNVGFALDNDLKINDGGFTARLRHKIDSKALNDKVSACNVSSVFDIGNNGGGRVYLTYTAAQDADTGKLSISTTTFAPMKNGNGVDTTATFRPELDVWYEYLFSFIGDGKVSVYVRKEGDAAWTTIKDGFEFKQSASLTLDRVLVAKNTFDYVDDIIIYKGTGVNVNAPVIANGAVTADGWVAYGTPKSEKNRRATVLVALYNADNTLCDVVTKDITLPAGEVTKFSISEPTTASSAKVMVWDSTATLIPLGSSAD